MVRKSTKQRPEYDFIVVSYVDGERRLHREKATSYRKAKSKAARELREELGLWDTNLSEIVASGMMLARKVPKEVF